MIFCRIRIPSTQFRFTPLETFCLSALKPRLSEFSMSRPCNASHPELFPVHLTPRPHHQVPSTTLLSSKGHTVGGSTISSMHPQDQSLSRPRRMGRSKSGMRFLEKWSGRLKVLTQARELRPQRYQRTASTSFLEALTL